MANQKGKRRGFRTALAALLCTVALAVAAWVLLERKPKPALKIARLFGVVKQWNDRNWNEGDYFWLDNDHTLFVCGNSGAPRRYLRVIGSQSNPSSGTSTLLPFTTSGYMPSLSPDGRCIVSFEWGPDLRRPRKGLLTVRRMDGTTILRKEWPSDLSYLFWTGNWFWAPDSSSLYQLSNSRDYIARLSLKTGRLENTALPAHLLTGNQFSRNVLGFSDHGTLLLANGGGAHFGIPVYVSVGFAAAASPVNVPTMSLLEVSLGRTVRLVRTFSPTLPPGGGSGSFQLSPQGDRLFWNVFYKETVSPLQARIHHFLPFVPGGGAIAQRCWVSRLDGSGMKEIGYNFPPAAARRPNTNPPSIEGWIYDPKWTPDGKRISFYYNGRIMTMPAE